MKDKLIRAETKAALLAEGCHDPDVALQLADLSGIKASDAGDVDAESVKATVKTLKESKAYLFTAPTTNKKEGDEPKSALDMSGSEYKAARRALMVASGDRERVARGGGEPDLAATSAKSALDMKPEDFLEPAKEAEPAPTPPAAGAAPAPQAGAPATNPAAPAEPAAP